MADVDLCEGCQLASLSRPQSQIDPGTGNRFDIATRNPNNSDIMRLVQLAKHGCIRASLVLVGPDFGYTPEQLANQIGFQTPTCTNKQISFDVLLALYRGEIV